jgi:hypothetical protein
MDCVLRSRGRWNACSPAVFSRTSRRLQRESRFASLEGTTTCNTCLDFVKNYTNYALGTLTIDFTATTLPLRKHFTHPEVGNVK